MCFLLIFTINIVVTPNYYFYNILLLPSQLQERLDDLQSRLQRERDSWKLQETLYNERLKVFQDIQEVFISFVFRNVLFNSLRSPVRIKSARYVFSIRNVFINFLQALVLTQLEESDVMRQSLLEKHSSLQQQLAQVQVQLYS